MKHLKHFEAVDDIFAIRQFDLERLINKHAVLVRGPYDTTALTAELVSFFLNQFCEFISKDGEEIIGLVERVYTTFEPPISDNVVITFKVGKIFYKVQPEFPISIYFNSKLKQEEEEQPRIRWYKKGKLGE